MPKKGNKSVKDLQNLIKIVEEIDIDAPLQDLNQQSNFLGALSDAQDLKIKQHLRSLEPIYEVEKTSETSFVELTNRRQFEEMKDRLLETNRLVSSERSFS